MVKVEPRANRVFLLLLLLAAGPAAAGGPEIGDQGAKAMGRGGAFTVRADDLSAMDYNPAGLARQRGTSIYLNNRLTYGEASFKRARTLDWGEATHGVPRLVLFDEVSNEDPLFPIAPMAGVASDFGLERWTFAAGVFAPPAVGRLKFPDSGPQRYMLVEQEVIMLLYNISAAWRPRDDFAVGLSLHWVDVPLLNYELVVDGNVSPKQVHPEQSRFDIRTRVEGADRVGISGIFGLWYRPLRSLELALAGRFLPIKVKTDSRLYLEPEHLLLDEPIQITRNGLPDNQVSFSFTMPVKFRGGVRYVHYRGDQELFDLELDIHYDLWSMMENYTLDAGITTEVMGQMLTIDKVVIEKQSRDTVSVRLGGDFKAIPGWLDLRAGFFYESPSVRPGYAYLDAFSFHRWGPGGGLSLIVGPTRLDLGYTWLMQRPLVVTEEEARIYQQVPGSPCQAPYTDPSYCNERYLGKPAAPANAGTWQASYHLFNAALSVNL